MSALAPARASLRLPTEVALVAVSVSALVGFRRLFVDWSFLTEPLVLLLLSHVVAVALRARRVPVALAAVVSAVAGAIATSLLLYRGTTRWWLPSLTTVEAVGDDLQLALELFRDVKAPAEVLPGFIVATALTFWVVGFLADWAAFRLDAAVEATIPAGGLFIFGALFGADILRLQLTVVFALACLVFILLHRSSRQEVGMPWVRGDARRGSRAFVRAGATLTALGVLLGLAAAPLLPGSGSPALVDWKDLGGRQGTRITVSPLVDIQARLVEQANTVAFTVRSAVRSYWRLTALDSFDGRMWRSDQRFTRVDDELDNAVPEAELAEVSEVAQEFTIDKLSQIWLPAAYQPVEIDAGDVEVRWEDSTSTLIVDDATSDGMRYNVTSVVPRFDQRALAVAPSNVPDDIAEQYLVLPDGFSDAVRAEAARVTAGASTPYQQAIALQTYFRSSFTYTTDAPSGHGGSEIERFLFETRAGYCEQFAGSFAAMARAIGLPARVAVGFTPGDQDPDDPNTWVVRGKHAHAWPEVYIDGFGWVLFEPTPNRGAPGAEYTGVAEEQDGAVGPTTPTGDAITTTTVASSQVPSPDGGLLIEEFPIEGGGVTGTTAPPPSDGSGFFGQARWILPGLAGLVLLYAAVVLGAKRVRRALRRRRARTERQRIDLAWREAVESLGVLGIHAEPSETPTEFAGRVRERNRVDATGLRQLAELATQARYSPDDAAPGSGDEARGTATAVLEVVREHTTVGQRLGYDLSPRSLWRRARRR